MGFRCLGGFSGLFRRCCERVVTQIVRDLRVVRSGRKHLVAFPAAEGYRANLKQASSFRLEDFQLEPASSEMAANGGRFFWDWYSTVVGWQVPVAWNA